ncbi:Tfp pilus assembly protein FimT/FimU [Thiomonas sp. FB-Cd]|uniref:pilus assembly FimT family protein n=1 Tax=Thiomonas sp. FB-Cd TaxID=1158292 RepID=UPI0004DF1D66|nr:GspH/FimT family pseudopilin [Thiomonas sp. FB-Cd]
MKQRGFTLLELLVVIVIAAILFSVALPSFLSSIQGRQSVSVVSAFEQDIAWARGQAISNSPSVSMTLNADCTWTVNTGQGAEDAHHSMTIAQLQNNAPGISCTGVPAGGLVMTFDSLGMVSIPSGSTSNPNTIITVNSSAGGAPVSVQIFGSGVIVEDPQHAS